MTLDTLTISAIVDNLKENFINCRINKISQPERDEIMLTIRNKNGCQRLIININSSNPIIFIDNTSEKKSPKTALNFCMSLRKHISSGKIVDVIQIDYDRIIEFHIERYDELGDLKLFRLIIEFMGKHSNIILVNENNRILESIKHIDASTSSIRQVFPGSNYFRVYDENKIYPLDISSTDFISIIRNGNIFYETMMSQFKGIYPKLIFEICNIIGFDSHDYQENISSSQINNFFSKLSEFLNMINISNFSFNIYSKDNKMLDYSVLNFSLYNDYQKTEYDNIFCLIKDFYLSKLNLNKINDKTQKIRQIVNNNIKRLAKKISIWDLQLQDAQKKDTYRLYGELLLANTYITPTSNKIEVINYYDNSSITIPIDSNKSMAMNSQIYYKKYNKLKRTEEAIISMYPKVNDELEYLHSIIQSIRSIENMDDFNQIKYELEQNGYMNTIKNNSNKNKKDILTNTFIQYKDNLGFNYFVGKNNIQNDYITFSLASGNDWWFHIKNQPGSHVIVKTMGEDMPPDEVFINAASIAAFHTKISDSKIEVDYTQRKNLKKPKNGHMGSVIYHTNYSITVKPEIPNTLTRENT